MLYNFPNYFPHEPRIKDHELFLYFKTKCLVLKKNVRSLIGSYMLFYISTKNSGFRILQCADFFFSYRVI